MRDLKVISRMFIERRAQIVHVSKRNIGKYIVSRAVNKMLYDHYITNTYFFFFTRPYQIITTMPAQW